MAMADEDTVLSLEDVLDEDRELENTANAVLGDSEDSKCSYSKVILVFLQLALVSYIIATCYTTTQGYVGRQALYSCATCTAGGGGEPAGVCLACSLHCHEGHDLYELYTKRHFCCDCGNQKFPQLNCTLAPVSGCM